MKAKEISILQSKQKSLFNYIQKKFNINKTKFDCKVLHKRFSYRIKKNEKTRMNNIFGNIPNLNKNKIEIVIQINEEKDYSKLFLYDNVNIVGDNCYLIEYDYTEKEWNHKKH